MDDHPYHSYLFFDLDNQFYQLPEKDQSTAKQVLTRLIKQHKRLIIAPYLTRGLKAGTDFMLWCRAQDPAEVSVLLGKIFRTELGRYLTLSRTYFGIVRPSQYSGRTGKPEQVMQNYTQRLPYFVLYPFTKTHEWHQLDLDQRKTIMQEHMNLGISFPDIRQCLLYSYGVDDQEFVVSYEMPNLEVFQDLVIKLRATKGRPYTLQDTPIYTCLYRSADQLLEEL